MNDDPEDQSLTAASQQTQIAALKACIGCLTAEVEILCHELKSIANADTIAWDSPGEFETWAKNRARHALARI